VAILGPTRTGSAVAVARELPTLEIPMISVGSTGDWRSAAGVFNAWTFRTTRVDTYLIEPLLRFVRDSLKLSRVALFSTSDDDWSKSLAPVYRATLDTLGMQLVADESQKTGELDRGAQLQRIRSARPQALIINVIATDAPTIADQARRVGVTSQLIGTGGFTNPSTWSLAAAGVLDGVVVAENYDASGGRPAVKNFQQLYRERHEGEAPPYAAYAWDAILLVADACRRADPCSDRAKLRDAIASTRSLEAVLGVMTFTGPGDAEKEPLILEIQSGSYRLRQAAHADRP